MVSSTLTVLDVEDLVFLPKGYRYELHDGRLVIEEPTNFWQKEQARRFLFMLSAAGLDAFQDPGVCGDRPRDCRTPDLGVVISHPADFLKRSTLPGPCYGLVIEVFARTAPNGEYTSRMAWYAECGIPEYWIADDAPDDYDDALVLMHRLVTSGGKPAYVCERTVLLSQLEAEYRAKNA